MIIESLSGEGDVKQQGFPFSMPDDPMLATEEIEVALLAPTLPTSTDPPKQLGLSRSKSWKDKSSSISRRCFMKNSGSFTLGSRSNAVRQSYMTTMPTSNTKTSTSPEIEVKLGTSSKPRARDRFRKNERVEVLVPDQDSSTAKTVHEFITTTRNKPLNHKRNTEKKTAFGDTLLGKSIHRVGSRISCRSTASSYHKSFNRFDSTICDRSLFRDGPNNDETRKVESTSMSLVNENEKATAASVPNAGQSDLHQAWQGNDGDIWEMDAFNDQLDNLLEKVELRGSSTSSVASPDSEHEREASRIIDKVSRFQI